MRLLGADVIAMCFSSSIICLLIVSSHGAPAASNESRTLLHRRNNHLLTDLKNILNSSHHRSYQKDLIPHNDYLTHHASESPARSSKTTSHLLRKQRSAEDAEQLNAVSAQGSTGSNPSDASQSPVQQESSSSQISRQSDTSNLQNNSQPSKSAEQQNASNCGQKHSNHDCGSNGEHDCDHNHEHEAEHEHDHDHEHEHQKQGNISGAVWLYASIAVVIISLCGLLSVAIIPIMQKWFYHTLLQFLVGLAVGSLSGDGLLHLMPHAILGGEESHDHGSHNHNIHKTDCMDSLEQRAIWRGLAALGGIFIFFIAERLLGTLTAYRRQKKEAKLSRHSKNMLPVMQREDGTNNGNVGEKLAQPKKNSYDHIREKDEKETIQMLQTEATPTRKGSSQSTHEIGFHGRSSFSLEPEMSVAYRPESESSVIVSDHHGHSHGHRHDIPQSVSAVALMVIMGDGLHNFCDGLAIGAAFASSSADGVSTTVAVFCHELPHELGDFAMLLKTGMKVKQALFYNGLSSILCFVGMVIGVCLGNVNSATNWVFAGTAGMFLYIALVDMLPELTSDNESGLAALTTLAVQFLGISIGICIMLLIALYEHELLAIVS